MKRYEYNYGKNPEGTLSTISGYATETTNFGETAFGILNKSTRDEENFTTPEVVSSSTATLFSVGNGTDHDSRKNIIELKADGTVYINGVGQYDGTNPGESTNIADEFQGIHDDITGLNEDVDRIDNTIESIHISEDNENLIYTLLVDGQERGTINIPRDQFLKDISYNEETNNLEFIFIVRGEDNEEVEKQINVSMTDLEDIYSAGDGLSLENKQFSVKVDADTQSYIEVSSNGVKVIGIDEKFNTVNQNVTDLTNRVTTAESDIDAIQDELANLEGSGEGSVQDQINDALQSYLPLSGGTMAGNIEFSGSTTMGIIIQGKSDTDLVNAAGGTTSISDILAEVPSPDLSSYATKSELENYLPLSGGTIDGLININGSSIKISDPNDSVDSYLSMEHSGSGNSGPIIRLNWGEDVQTYINAYGMDVNMSHYGSEGVRIKDKTASDLLNAGGSTTPISDIVTQVQAAIVDSAPETLDTLNELAAALGDDPNFATTVTNQIAQKASISGLPNNIVPAILPTPIYSDTYVRITHQYCAKDSSSGTFGTAQSSFTQINAATSTTAGVLTAEDFNKLQFITAVTDTAVHGIKQITFNSATSDTAKIYTLVDQNAGEGIYNTTLVLEVTDDASETADADSIDAIELRTTGLGGQNADTIVRVTDILKSRNPNSGMLERVANISELPSVVTTSADGLMSAADKTKLDQITITDGDIVANGFRITDGTADEVLTADGDSNTLKTINGQTLLGSGDVDMSEFALKTDLDDYLSAGGGTVAGDISVESIEDTNTLTITNTGINISGKTNNDLIAAAGGTTTLKTINGESLLGSGDITTPSPTVNAASGIKTIWTGTQSEYDGIATKDANTLYFITEE